MPKARRAAKTASARQHTAQQPQAEADNYELTTTFTDIANALEDCGHEAKQVLHHWLQLKKQITSCDTDSSPAWLGRVQARLHDFTTEARKEIETDRVAKEELARKDSRIRDLEEEVARLSDAAMIAGGQAVIDRAADADTILKLRERNAQVEESNALLRTVTCIYDQQAVLKRDDKIVELKAIIDHLGPKPSERRGVVVSKKNLRIHAPWLPQWIGRISKHVDRHLEVMNEIRTSKEELQRSLDAAVLPSEIHYFSVALEIAKQYKEATAPLVNAMSTNMDRKGELTQELQKLVEESAQRMLQIERCGFRYRNRWEVLREERFGAS
ncbi:hypothetical protein CB0940_09314 [Cercospora beticola]|uniref:Uncharacterized protein n=1 Tax=Cercospora beticola TaxID=122368 RepID=A0A2G5HJ70_CERBT|nr:hypothetical protein CB0940_09314 [Cercospora beticola]PIA92253.1 hypothetical protein CB0940_09314 [Cercospora beticola]WPB06373.1 hypothetical protein RHO25_011030 [Cercospora beticola]CAK1366265.1 unnamed protein product [Cercospora beticola]